MTLPRYSARQKGNLLFIVSFVLVAVVVLGGLGLGAYYVNKRDQSYDVGSQAFIPSGGVAKIELAAPNEVSQAVGQSQRVALRFSTQQAPISGVQVVVEMKHSTFSDVVFTPSTIAGLELISSETEAMSGGKRFLLAYGSNPLTTPFNNGIAFQTLGHFEYVQPQGVLTLEFTTDTITVAPETGNDTLAAPDKRLVAYGLQTTPTPTPSSGVGGITVLACNSQCGTHAQCAANHFCSNGRCRNTACSGSENCVCTTPTPRASTISSPTPRVTPRATPRATPGSQNVFGEDSKGFDPLVEDASIAARMDASPTPLVLPSSDNSGEGDYKSAMKFSPGAIMGIASVVGIGLLLLLLILLALRGRKRHDKEALHSLGMMVHSTQPAQEKMAETIQESSVPEVEPLQEVPAPDLSEPQQSISEQPQPEITPNEER
jgi:hypothetical protein